MTTTQAPPTEQDLSAKPTPDQDRLAFDTLMQCRNLEVTLFSTRSGLCFAIQAGVLAFIGRAILELPPTATLRGRIIAALLAGMGALISVACLQIVRGASLWVKHWEYKLRELEPRVIGSNTVFRRHPGYDPAVRNEPGRKYVSSRRATIIVCWIFIVLWAILAALVLAGLGGVARPS